MDNVTFEQALKSLYASDITDLIDVSNIMQFVVENNKEKGCKVDLSLVERLAAVVDSSPNPLLGVIQVFIIGYYLALRNVNVLPTGYEKHFDA